MNQFIHTDLHARYIPLSNNKNLIKKLIIHEVEYCTCGFSLDALGTQNDLQNRNVVNLRTKFVGDVCDKLLSECSALSYR